MRRNVVVPWPQVGLLYQSLMNMELWWNNNELQKLKVSREAINQTSTTLVLIPGLLHEKPATNHLKCVSSMYSL